MRVVVTGLAATYPLGGVAWDYLQYVLGFRALGCDVFYLEDTGQWLYDPAATTFTPTGDTGARWLGACFAGLAPGVPWAMRSADGVWHGAGEDAVARACTGADLLLNVSGAARLSDVQRRARVLVYVDTDPGYSQAVLAADEDRWRVDGIRAHDVFFTLGANVGRPGCSIPTVGIAWHPTRPPIALAHWPRMTTVGHAFTTVMSWRIEPAPPRIGGRTYGGKDVELLRGIELPRLTSVVLEAAISGAAPRERLADAGWRLADPGSISSSPADFRAYLQGSAGELSFAKEVYVATRSGWFGPRSAAYLACGRPVVLQDTGFGDTLPLGAGLHPFTTPADAAAALETIEAHPRAAASYARALAEEHFDAERVCTALLRDAGL